MQRLWHERHNNQHTADTRGWMIDKLSFATACHTSSQIDKSMIESSPETCRKQEDSVQKATGAGQTDLTDCSQHTSDGRQVKNVSRQALHVVAICPQLLQ